MESTSVTSYISVMQVAHNAYDIQLTCNWAASVGINLLQVSMRPRETFATYSSLFEYVYHIPPDCQGSDFNLIIIKVAYESHSCEVGNRSVGKLSGEEQFHGGAFPISWFCCHILMPTDGHHFLQKSRLFCPLKQHFQLPPWCDITPFLFACREEMYLWGSRKQSLWLIKR